MRLCSVHACCAAVERVSCRLERRQASADTATAPFVLGTGMAPASSDRSLGKAAYSGDGISMPSPGSHNNVTSMASVGPTPLPMHMCCQLGR